MDVFSEMLHTIPWFAWIPIVAIICGTVQATIKMSHVHQQRMEMIRMGMHPDLPTEKPVYDQQEV